MINRKTSLVLIVLFITFIILSFFVKGSSFPVDIIINSWASGITSKPGISFFNFIAWLGDIWGIIIMGIIAIGFFIYKKLYLKAGVFIGTILLTVGSSTLVKHLVGRIRPENMVVDYHGFSFPSGHSTMAILFFLFLVILTLEEIKSNIAKIILIILSINLGVLIIFSRIYLSVHWFTDVIGGIILGTFWLIVGINVYKYLKEKDKYS